MVHVASRGFCCHCRKMYSRDIEKVRKPSVYAGFRTFNIYSSSCCSRGFVFCIAGLLEAVLLVELVHAAAGVDELLLAGVERVALGADFNRDVLLGGTGLNHVAAGAANRGRLIIGMNTFFH